MTAVARITRLAYILLRTFLYGFHIVSDEIFWWNILTKWQPFVQTSNGWASSLIRNLYFLQTSLFSTIQNLDAFRFQIHLTLECFWYWGIQILSVQKMQLFANSQLKYAYFDNANLENTKICACLMRRHLKNVVHGYKAVYFRFQKT